MVYGQRAHAPVAQARERRWAHSHCMPFKVDLSRKIRPRSARPASVETLAASRATRQRACHHMPPRRRARRGARRARAAVRASREPRTRVTERGRLPLDRPSHGDTDDSAACFCAHDCASCASCSNHANAPRRTRTNECGEQWREVKGTRKRVKTHPWRESIFLVEFCEPRQNSASSVSAALVAFGKCVFRPVQCDASTLCLGSSEDHHVSVCLATTPRFFSSQIFQRLPAAPSVAVTPRRSHMYCSTSLPASC